jgi:hypothetical protein
MSRVSDGTILVFVFMAATICRGQAAPRIRDTNLNSWWTLVIDTPIKGNLGFHFEAPVRRSDFLNTWYQLQFHEAATYKFSPNIVGTVGYVWMRTGRYGAHPVAHAYVEQRVYAELRVRQFLKKAEVEHRYRFDHRYLQNYSDGDNFYWRRQERVRYQAKLSYPLTKIGGRGQQWFVVGGDEILLHVGPNHGPSAFDQNRLFGGFAYKPNSNHRLEAVYMNQYKYLHDGQIAELDHTLRVQLALGFGRSGRK